MSALRDYQRQAIRDIYQQWGDGKRAVLLSMPTGSGKTRTFSEIAANFAGHNEQVLLLCHREELLLQSQQTMEQVTGISVGTIQGDRALHLTKLIQCASVQTLVRRLESGQIHLPQVSLIIVDEAHLSLAASYVSILSYFPSALILGVTATPCRLDGKGFDELYNALVLGPSVADLIGRGYLADYDVLAPESFIPNESKEIRITGGDFNVGDLAERLDRRYVSGSAVDAYRRYARGRRCVVFAINIEHSKAIAERYQAVGIPAEHIDGDTPSKERQAILGRFRSGATAVLANVNLFTEGFDLPEIDVVQLCRPTQSVALHLQMVGRGLRPKYGRKALILDHAGNCLRLGGPKARRVWTLQGLDMSAAPELPPAPPPVPTFAPPYIDLPQFPKRQVEIFETPVAMGYIPTEVEIETQLAQAAYREPRHSDRVGTEYSESYERERSDRTLQRTPRNTAGRTVPRSPNAHKRRTPRPRSEPGLGRQLGRAAIELAELLESILQWLRRIWSPPRPRKRRRRTS